MTVRQRGGVRYQEVPYAPAYTNPCETVTLPPARQPAAQNQFDNGPRTTDSEIKRWLGWSPEAYAASATKMQRAIGATQSERTDNISVADSTDPNYGRVVSFTTNGYPDFNLKYYDLKSGGFVGDSIKGHYHFRVDPNNPRHHSWGDRYDMKIEPTGQGNQYKVTLSLRRDFVGAVDFEIAGKNYFVMTHGRSANAAVAPNEAAKPAPSSEAAREKKLKTECNLKREVYNQSMRGLSKALDGLEEKAAQEIRNWAVGEDGKGGERAKIAALLKNKNFAAAIKAFDGFEKELQQRIARAPARSADITDEMSIDENGNISEGSSPNNGARIADPNAGQTPATEPPVEANTNNEEPALGARPATPKTGAAAANPTTGAAAAPAVEANPNNEEPAPGARPATPRTGAAAANPTPGADAAPAVEANPNSEEPAPGARPATPRTGAAAANPTPGADAAPAVEANPNNDVPAPGVRQAAPGTGATAANPSAGAAAAEPSEADKLAKQALLMVRIGQLSDPKIPIDEKVATLAEVFLARPSTSTENINLTANPMADKKSDPFQIRERESAEWQLIRENKAAAIAELSRLGQYTVPVGHLSDENRNKTVRELGIAGKLSEDKQSIVVTDVLAIDKVLSKLKEREDVYAAMSTNSSLREWLSYQQDPGTDEQSPLAAWYAADYKADDFAYKVEGITLNSPLYNFIDGLSIADMKVVAELYGRNYANRGSAGFFTAEQLEVIRDDKKLAEIPSTYKDIFSDLSNTEQIARLQDIPAKYRAFAAAAFSELHGTYGSFQLGGLIGTPMDMELKFREKQLYTSGQ